MKFSFVPAGCRIVLNMVSMRIVGGKWDWGAGREGWGREQDAGALCVLSCFRRSWLAITFLHSLFIIIASVS